MGNTKDVFLYVDVCNTITYSLSISIYRSTRMYSSWDPWDQRSGGLRDPEVPAGSSHVHGISDTNTLGITREYHYALHVEHMYVCSICIVYSILLHTLYLVECSREYAYSASLLFSLDLWGAVEDSPGVCLYSSPATLYVQSMSTNVHKEYYVMYSNTLHGVYREYTLYM